MRILKKILILFLIIVIFIIKILENSSNAKMINSSIIAVKPTKVAVVVYNINAPFITEIENNLNDIQKKHEEKVEYTFFTSNENQSEQNKIIDKLLQSKEYDLYLVALVEINSVQEVVNKIKIYNLPVIFFNREPYKKDAIQSYEKSIFVGSTVEEAGIFQGEIIIDNWKRNKASIDRNRDNTMQYIMLKGRPESLDTIYRSKYSILAIQDAGINIQELASEIANWDEEQAKTITTNLILRYGDRIEVIISNNDAMAIGAIEALHGVGYNNGDMNKTIPVVGVDAIPKAIELIKKGEMTGTVIQDAKGMANALYTIGMNLISNKKPLEGTEYKFDDSGVSVRIAYKPYIPS